MLDRVPYFYICLFDFDMIINFLNTKTMNYFSDISAISVILDSLVSWSVSGGGSWKVAASLFLCCFVMFTHLLK